MIDITPIVQALILALAAFLTPRICDWLAARTGAAERADLEAWVRIAVAAAEQLYSSAQGEVKKRYVTAFLEQHGFTVDGEALNNAIEAAVLELHRGLREKEG